MKKAILLLALLSTMAFGADTQSFDGETVTMEVPQVLAEKVDSMIGNLVTPPVVGCYRSYVRCLDNGGSYPFCQALKRDCDWNAINN